MQMDTKQVSKKISAITVFAILAASTFTIVGALPFFNVQQAEAQGLQLRVSAAENPAFENHFFGAQIVQIVIDDPGATDPDESTVGLVVLGTTTPRVHLSDGLWYTFVAEDQGFSILADVLTDGLRDNRIAVSKAANDAGTTMTIGGFTYTIDTNKDDSFVAEFELGPANFPFVQLNQVDIFSILPQPFFNSTTTVNPDLRIGKLNENIADGSGVSDTGTTCDTAGGGLPTGGATDAAEGDEDCDWPYIRLLGLEELGTMEVRAGAVASVVLVFDDLSGSITAGLDRTTDYPLNAEVINSFTDFMWNINPVEEDSVFFVLDRNTGRTKGILYQPIAGFDPTDNDVTNGGENLPDLFSVFTSSPGMEFDERQVLELDAEGVKVLKFAFFKDDSSTASNAVIGQFAASPVTFDADAAKRVDQFAGATVFQFNRNVAGGVDGDATDDPIIAMFEGDPNVSVFDNTVEAAGGRATLFTGKNDRVASFDYFDIIRSAPMTTHDGFTSVDREVYDSADRAVFTVTDSDQNLRSRISEEPSGRDSQTFIRIGNPIPLVNTRNGTAGGNCGGDLCGISNTSLDNVIRIWEAQFMVAGDGAAGNDADNNSFGFSGFGFTTNTNAGANILADVNNDGNIDIGIGVTEGEERFHANATDIELADLTKDNRRIGMRFATTGIQTDHTTALIIDTKLTLDDIDGFVDIKDITGEELLGQVYIDNLEDESADQVENFLVQTARINERATTTNILGRNATIGGTTAYDVRLPQYNLINIDLTDLIVAAPFGDVLVKIDAVATTDSGLVGTSCIPDGAENAVTAQDAFDLDCVTASQVIDFSFENGQDTDATNSTGNVYRKSDGTAFAAGDGVTQLHQKSQPWFELTDGDAVAARKLNNNSTGFDRDPLTRLAGVGAFRSLDLVDVADQAGTATRDHLKDRIRVTILLLSPAANTVVAGGTFNLDEPIETINKGKTHTVVVDFAGMNIGFDPAPDTSEGDRRGDFTQAVKVDNIASPLGNTFTNLAYRLELDEEGSNSSIFTGRADFFTFIQFDTVPDVLNEIVLTGDPLKIWLPNRFIPPNRLALTSLDEDIVQFFREVSATYIYETRDGSVEWDRSSFSFGQDAFLTITDEDLNREPDATERYNLPLDGFVFFELGKQRVCSDAIGCAFGTLDAFANQIDATLLETGPNTGTFVAQITMPSLIRIDITPGTTADRTSAATQQRDIEANYIDIRDRSSVRQEFDDITNIRTTLGDVVLDRAAYPPGALMFVEIHDNDYNQDVDIRETIDLRQIVITEATTGTAGSTGESFGTRSEGARISASSQSIAGAADRDPDCDKFTEFVDTKCGNAAPILEVTIFKAGVGKLATLLPADFLDLASTGKTGKAVPSGLTSGSVGVTRFGSGISVTNDTASATNNVLPILSRDGLPVTTALETGPNTGIFEFEVRLPGPARNTQAFPVTLPGVLTSGTVDTPTINANQPIQVTYTDNADESGEAEDEEELATILFNTARLRTDKLEYGLGEPVDIIVEEPDFNLDSRSVDEASFTILDVITDKFDTDDGSDTTNLQSVIDKINDDAAKDTTGVKQSIRTNLTVLRETGFNTGVFVVQIEEIVEDFVDRGEDVEVVYRDKTPSGGGTAIRIEYEFLVVEILPEIIFDKEEYTPFDEFIVSIISPDSNQDPDRIEVIRPIISSSSASLGQQRLPETGPNTGIFEEDFDLTPNRDQFPGELLAIREDGVTVEFRIDEDTVATKSVFVNYHVGQVMFDKDAFRISERGTLRVIDPDQNTHPDTIDTIRGTDMRFWSTTDRGGLAVVLRETGDRTGIFEEIISFTPDEESTGTRLRVSEGDTITAKYTDRTLPAPAALAADFIFTVEVEELFASALIGAIVPPLERAVASEPELVDQTGAALTDVTVGSQVLVQSEITNSQTKKQPFAYIVQIKDENGVTISLSWVTGELPAKETLKAAQSWIPDAAGDFTVEIFVWESVDNPVALSPVRTSTVSVS